MTLSARGAERVPAASALPRTFTSRSLVRETSLRALGCLTQARETRRARVDARELPPIVAGSRQRAFADASSLREDALARMLRLRREAHRASSKQRYARSLREDALARMLRLRLEAR